MTNILPLLPYLAYALVVLFIILYAILSSIEFGAAVLLALPTPPIDRDRMERYFGPAWEATNVFLIFSLVGLAMFFPASVPILNALYTVIGLALLFLVVRIVGILGIFYVRDNTPIFRLLFALGSLGAPLVLSVVYYFTLTGNLAHAIDALLAALWASVLGAIGMIASAFFARFDTRADHAILTRIHTAAATLFFVGASGVVLEIQPPFAESLALFVALLLLISVLISIRFMGRGRFLAGFLVSTLSVTLLIAGAAYLHLPYLIYPVLTVADAFTAPAMFIAMLEVVPFGLIIAIPAIALLWYLFAREQH